MKRVVIGLLLMIAVTGSIFAQEVQDEPRSRERTNMVYGLQNMLFGLGSYRMGDRVGGIVSSVGLGTGSVLLIIGFGTLIDAALEANQAWNNSVSAADQTWYNSGFNSGSNDPQRAYDDKWNQGSSKAVPFFVAGSVTVVVSWIWGFIRPSLFTKSASAQKVASIVDRTNVLVLPNFDTGRTTVMLSYNYSF